jgi:predicted lactoylglutathione lyase
MIGYVTVGVKDLEKAGAFYDALFAELGATRLMEMDRLILWGTGMDKPMFGACIPFNKEEQHPGNGTMMSLKVENPEQIAKIHAKALELGGTCEGAPGPRDVGTFNGGYFRDLDGNKLVAYCFT